MSWMAQSAAVVLTVPSVEASLTFFEDRLGFQRIADVPHGAQLGFAMLIKDSVQVMLQSIDSVREDMAAAIGDGPTPGTASTWYVRVADLEALIAALGDYPIALPRRDTFYGADEIGVREPGGHLIVFARPPAE